MRGKELVRIRAIWGPVAAVQGAPHSTAALSDPKEPLEGHRDRKNAPHRRTFSLLRLFNARLATARLIDQCGLTALAVLTAPSLDRRLAGNLVLDHGLANRQAVFQTVLNHSELYVVRIGVMMRTGIENGVGTAHGIRAGPLTSRGLGNAKLRGDSARPTPSWRISTARCLTSGACVRVLVASDIPTTS